MSLMDSHKKRANGIRHFITSNKLFLIIALIAVIFVCTGMIRGIQTQESAETPETPETASQTEPQSEEIELPAWRFYPSDFIILLVGGGICVIMIRRERSKAKEGLD